jgi:hypothetical protein
MQSRVARQVDMIRSRSEAVAPRNTPFELDHGSTLDRKAAGHGMPRHLAPASHDAAARYRIILRDGDVLEVEDLAIRFGSAVVLRGLSFAVPAGSTLAGIGPNDSGKTVRFRALVGSLPYQGTVRWEPRSPDRIRAPEARHRPRPPDHRARRAPRRGRGTHRRGRRAGQERLRERVDRLRRDRGLTDGPPGPVIVCVAACSWRAWSSARREGQFCFAPSRIHTSSLR